MQSNIQRDWYLIDAKDKALGRVATEIADLLRGKKKVDFAPNADKGDYVVVINADKFVLTGKKEETKRYYKHTGYLGNLKTTTVAELKEKKPGEVLKKAVTGMLPKNKLQDEFLGRLKVYADETHPHANVKFKNQG
jgi:large subunit ribosomal protein L13